MKFNLKDLGFKKKENASFIKDVNGSEILVEEFKFPISGFNVIIYSNPDLKNLLELEETLKGLSKEISVKANLIGKYSPKGNKKQLSDEEKEALSKMEKEAILSIVPKFKHNLNNYVYFPKFVENSEDADYENSLPVAYVNDADIAILIQHIYNQEELVPKQAENFSG